MYGAVEMEIKSRQGEMDDIGIFARIRHPLKPPPRTDTMTDLVHRPLARVATPDDFDALAALFAASYPPLMAAAYAPDVLAAALPIITKPSPVLLASARFGLVEDAAGQAIACGGYSLERPGGGAIEPGLAHIRHFATHPAFTGQGFGRVVFEWCVAGARALGCQRFECYAALNAVPFYRALGFAPVREHIVSLMGVPFPSLVMTARIN